MAEAAIKVGRASGRVDPAYQLEVAEAITEYNKVMSGYYIDDLGGFVPATIKRLTDPKLILTPRDGRAVDRMMKEGAGSAKGQQLLPMSLEDFVMQRGLAGYAGANQITGSLLSGAPAAGGDLFGQVAPDAH